MSRARSVSQLVGANTALGNTVITGTISTSTNTATFGTAVYGVANGNVGIGNSSPVKSLHVTGAVPQVRINEAGGSYWDLEGGGRFNIQNGSGTIMLSIGQGDTAPIGNGIRIANSGVTIMPNQPSLLAQPDAGSFAMANSGISSIFGWNTSGSIRYNRGFAIGAGTASLDRRANAASTGRITVPEAGAYLINFDMRNESSPATNDSGAGQMYVYVNGTGVIRRHTNIWGNFPYNHVAITAVLNLAANDYLEFGAWWNSNGSNIGNNVQGTNDTVNWLSIVKIS